MLIKLKYWQLLNIKHAVNIYILISKDNFINNIVFNKNHLIFGIIHVNNICK